MPWPKDDDDDESCAEPVVATANANGDTPVSEQESTPETFILCRSRDRSKKEEAMTQRFETKIEESLVRMKAGCEKKNRDIQKGVTGIPVVRLWRIGGDEKGLIEEKTC